MDVFTPELFVVKRLFAKRKFHQSIFFCLSGAAEEPRPPSQATTSSLSRRTPRCSQQTERYTVRLSRWDMPKTLHPRGVQQMSHFPSHLIWLLSVWKNILLHLADLLTPSVKEKPATLERKLISTSCICSLILAFTTQSP